MFSEMKVILGVLLCIINEKLKYNVLLTMIYFSASSKSKFYDTNIMITIIASKVIQILNHIHLNTKYYYIMIWYLKYGQFQEFLI